MLVCLYVFEVDKQKLVKKKNQLKFWFIFSIYFPFLLAGLSQNVQFSQRSVLSNISLWKQDLAVSDQQKWPDQDIQLTQ